MSGEPIDHAQVIGAALKREKEARDAAWLDVPAKICGRDFQQITIRHYMMLEAVDSPFVRGVIPTPEQLAQFLWIISPGFSTDPGEALRFTKGIAELPFTQAVKESMDLVETTFLDAPQGSGKAEDSTSYYSWVASIIDALASEYGWRPFEIIDLPLRQVFQLLRAMKKRHDPKCGMINNLSDRAKLDYLASLKKAA